MQFANPIWLWALSGLVIPVGIHLLSRKEGKVIYIGSLRHLDESSTRQFKAIRLNEILLLIIRCVLIILTVLFLAGIQWRHTPTEKQKWLVIEPGIAKDNTTTSLTDSLTVVGYEVHYLAPGFPVEADTTTYTKNYWTLLDQLKSSRAQEVVVLSRSYLKDFAGEQIALPSTIKWITVDAAAGQRPVMAVRYKSDSAVVRSVKSGTQQTSFEYSRSYIFPEQQTISSQNDSIKLNTTDTLHVTIAYDKAFQYDANILAASVRSLQDIPAVTIQTTIGQVADFRYTPTDWLIWLSDKPLPQPATCHLITHKNEPTANAILYPEGPQTPHQHWILSERLNVDNALQQHLTTTLAAVLLQNSTLEQTAIEADQRIIPETFLQASSENLSATKRVIATMPLDKYLIVLIALMLLTERLLAYKRNQ